MDYSNKEFQDHLSSYHDKMKIVVYLGEDEKGRKRYAPVKGLAADDADYNILSIHPDMDKAFVAKLLPSIKKKTILLRSDMVGEDESYTMGAVLIPVEKDIAEFEHEVRHIMDNLRDQVMYEDNDLLVELEKRGYEIVDPPEEFVARS